jgi:hypothetical protein
MNVNFRVPAGQSVYIGRLVDAFGLSAEALGFPGLLGS